MIFQLLSTSDSTAFPVHPTHDDFDRRPNTYHCLYCIISPPALIFEKENICSSPHPNTRNQLSLWQPAAIKTVKTTSISVPTLPHMLCVCVGLSQTPNRMTVLTRSIVDSITDERGSMSPANQGKGVYTAHSSCVASQSTGQLEQQQPSHQRGCGRQEFL